MDYTIFTDRTIDRTKCPDHITLEMLHKELGRESRFYEDKDMLWQMICHLMMDKDEHGVYKE